MGATSDTWKKWEKAELEKYGIKVSKGRASVDLVLRQEYWHTDKGNEKILCGDATSKIVSSRMQKSGLCRLLISSLIPDGRSTHERFVVTDAYNSGVTRLGDALGTDLSLHRLAKMAVIEAGFKPGSMFYMWMEERAEPVKQKTRVRLEAIFSTEGMKILNSNTTIMGVFRKIVHRAVVFQDATAKITLLAFSNDNGEGQCDGFHPIVCDSQLRRAIAGKGEDFMEEYIDDK